MSSVSKWLRSESAATTTEYAVIIALVAAALILAGDSVQLAADATFRKTAATLNTAPPDSGEVPLSQGQQLASSGLVALPISTSVPLLHGLAWAVLFMAAGVVGHSRYRRWRTGRILSELHCGPEPIGDEPGNPNFQKRQEIQRVLLKHFDDALHSRIEVRHVMSRRVQTVAQTAKVSDLRELMDREGFHHVVVAKHGVLLGVISDRDIKGRRGWLARHVMTASPLTVTPTTQVNTAISMLLHRRISCLPVVENGEVRGILTVTDMLMTLQCMMKLLERSQLTEEAAGQGPALAAAFSAASAGIPTAAC